MGVIYLPDQPSGHQFHITLDDGRRLVGVGAVEARAILRSSGLSVREAESEVAQAKLRAMAVPIS